MPPVRPIDGLFERLHQAGAVCAMYYGWQPLRDVSLPTSLDFPEYIQAYTEESSDTSLTDRALARMRKSQPDFVFLYMVETDEKGGHDRCHGTDMAEVMTIPNFYIGKAFPENVRFAGGSILDIAPTIAKLMGVPPAPAWEGKPVI